MIPTVQIFKSSKENNDITRQGWDLLISQYSSCVYCTSIVLEYYNQAETLFAPAKNNKRKFI